MAVTSKLRELHVVQVAFIRPLIDGLKEAGVPVDRLLRKSKLDLFQIDHQDCYVPLERMHEFFDLVSSSEVGPQFPALFASCYSLQNIGNWGVFLATCPDLLTTCVNSLRRDAQLYTHEVLNFDVSSARTAYLDSFVTPPRRAQAQTEQLTLTMMLDALRMVGGPDYVPLEVHLTGGSVDWLEEILPLDRTVVKLNQAEFGMVFPTDLLTLPMGDKASPSAKLDDMAGDDDPISSRVERLLDASQSAFIPTLEAVAETTGISPRSLQRYLSEEGASFSAVVEQWRFKTALKGLADPRISVREIGQNLRYGQSSDFIRAFRRWTGTTPQRYRDDLATHK